MNGEFNSCCSHYYHLTQQLAKEQAYLQKFLDNAPYYSGETQLSEIDYIIRYYYKTQAVKAAIDKTMARLNKTTTAILYFMRFFNIPPDTKLCGTIEEELEFEIWADDTDQIHTKKIKDLKPIEEPNTITIRIANERSSIFDDEDEWFPE